MAVYFDTSLLVKLYMQERDTPLVLQLVGSLAEPIALTPFQEVEFVNALHVKRGRGEVTAADLASAITNLHADLATAMFEWNEPDWKDVLKRTIRLSAQYAAKTLCRTLDAIHVATAIHLGVREFATNDKRQASLASAGGLKVLSP